MSIGSVADKQVTEVIIRFFFLIIDLNKILSLIRIEEFVQLM